MNTTRTLRTHHPIDPLLRRSDTRGVAPLPPPMTPALSSGAESNAEARVAALAARNRRGSSPSAPARRGKPARRAKLTALTLSAASTVSLAGLFAHQDDSAGAIPLTTVADPTATTAASEEPSATTATTAAATATTAATPTSEATATAVGGVADGTYVGASDSNRWGTVQVQVVYSGGVLTDVQIIQYPDGDDKSVRINQRALPTLISESLSAQSADVSTVSGATYTSVSYRVSLQSAIDAAKSTSGIG